MTSFWMALISESLKALVTVFVTSNKATNPVKEGVEVGTGLMMGCIVGLDVTNVAQIERFS